jgi:hypothetical protein
MGHVRRSVAVLAAATALGVTGCGSAGHVGTASATATLAKVPAPIVPTAPAHGALAKLDGVRLRVVDVGGTSCLALASDTGGPMAAVWPTGYTADATGNVVDAGGHVVAAPGQRLVLGGGTYAVDVSQPCSLGSAEAFYVNAVLPG